MICSITRKEKEMYYIKLDGFEEEKFETYGEARRMDYRSHI